jgi:HD-like signal output (HDOD) protein
MDSTLELPPLPAAHTRAMNLLNDPNINSSALAQVIETDPALTAAILRAANSALSAPVAPIDTANAAVIRIGLGDTRKMIVGAVASNAFQQLSRAEIDPDETWRHLVAVALLTQAAMWRAGTPRGAVSEAFTAGMLHDIGRLSMAAQDPSRYSLVATLARNGADMREAETRVFGFDHADWGGRVCEFWTIPDAVAEAIKLHHGGGSGDLAMALVTARNVARTIGIGDGLLPAEDVTFPEQPEHLYIVEELGGLGGLTEQIEWYRGALDSNHAAAAV